MEDPVNEKDLIISFPEDYNYLITALIYETDKIENGNAGMVVKTTDTNQDALFTADKKPNTSEILNSSPKLNCTALN